MPSQPPNDSDTASRLECSLGTAYEIGRLLGRGGFAEVYEVWDRELERQLAVKVLRPDVAWTAGMLQRFKQETRTVARLQHPNILPIYFVGEGEGLVYYAMPYVAGQSLGGLVRSSGPLSPRRAVEIAVPVLAALQHAHEHGLVHRDIKPDNILLHEPDGRPVLMDFGIAKRLDADGGLTQTGFVVGTPYYMSPEQALGQRDLDARSDIYAFGAVLFQLVTGSPPFDGESSQEIVGKHLAQPPPAPAEVNQRVPLWLSQVICRCLEKKPEDRFQSAAAVAEALNAGRNVAAVESTAGATPGASVDTDAVTEVVESGEQPGVRRGIPTRWRRLGLVGAPLLALGLFAGWWLNRPRLVFENALLAPVTLSLNSRHYRLEPDERISLVLPPNGPSAVLWNLERPSNAHGRPLGVELFGAISVSDPRGRIHDAAHASPDDRAFFAPLISNDTQQPLKIIVNAGTPHSRSCDCTVPAGAVRMLIGYYPLFRNSTVEAEDPLGRSATFSDLGSEVDRRTGVVRLRFEAKDFR
ncbi:MAG: serine/threonine protein kinase [Gemmatimonadota bacterium]|nr:MAG: serine/threonine protein kinase [Gemmatimonadota bacterium]